MKSVRIWVLILLAALLPLRGAMAAATLCPPAVEAPHAAHAHPGHTMDQPAPDHTTHTGHTAGDMQKCTLCCAFCAATPVMDSLPSVPLPAVHTTVSYTDLRAPAPSFLSDGQERPPRA